jgi:Zn finger protein HypA/HybF involved in hydrogenase expression
MYLIIGIIGIIMEPLQQLKCPHCGKELNKPLYRFCPNCNGDLKGFEIYDNRDRS